MGLQDDVNTDVTAIHANLNNALLAAGEIESTPVDLSEAINAINSEQTVDNSPIAAALMAICEAIDANGGDTTGARAAIASIGNGAVSFEPVKEALTAVAGVMGSVSENLDRAATATADHLTASSATVALLITKSNFDGANQ